jgi:hypothetical protein
MARLCEACAEIKARSDCRSAARELGPPRRYNSFLCSFCDDHGPSLAVGATGDKRYPSGAQGDALRPYRRARRVGFREGPQGLAAPAAHTTSEHDAGAKDEAKAVRPIRAYGRAPAHMGTAAGRPPPVRRPGTIRPRPGLRERAQEGRRD